MNKTMSLYFAALFLLSACATSKIEPINFKLTKVESLMLGSTIDQTKSIFGNPDEVSTENNETKWTYTFRYESKHGISYLPETYLTFNSDGKLISKYFNLFQETARVKASDIVTRYKNYSFKKIVETYASSHDSYDERGYLIDKKDGVRVDFSTYHDEEVTSIYWYIPDATDSPITPAKN